MKKVFANNDSDSESDDSDAELEDENGAPPAHDRMKNGKSGSYLKQQKQMFQPVFSLKTHDTDYGPAYVYSVLHPSKDKIVPTPVFLSEHYEYRGYELRMMSRVEYTTCVKIEKIKQNNKTPKNNPSKGGGRSASHSSSGQDPY